MTSQYGPTSWDNCPSQKALAYSENYGLNLQFHQSTDLRCTGRSWSSWLDYSKLGTFGLGCGHCHVVMTSIFVSILFILHFKWEKSSPLVVLEADKYILFFALNFVIYDHPFFCMLWFEYFLQNSSLSQGSTGNVYVVVWFIIIIILLTFIW